MGTKKIYDQWTQALRQPFEAAQMGPDYTPPRNWRGDPVSPAQAQPERGVEPSVFQPTDLLTGPITMGAKALTKGAVQGAEKVLASGAIKDPAGAWQAAKATFNHPKALAEMYRQWGQKVANPQDAENLAKAAESVPVWTRAAEAVKALKSYTPRAAEDIAIRDTTLAAARAAKTQPVQINTTAGKFFNSGASDKTVAGVR
jgi:uncharacterized protein YjiS (DUF1127 family)